MWVGFMTLAYVNYIPRALEQIKIIHLLFNDIHSSSIWKFAWSYIPATKRKKYYSYQDYSLEHC
jgi:DUF971 family protein